MEGGDWLLGGLTQQSTDLKPSDFTTRSFPVLQFSACSPESCLCASLFCRFEAREDIIEVF